MSNGSATATTAATATATATPTNSGSVGGHLTKKQRKEQFEALNALQTQLDVSVSLARSKVASWLNADAFSDDEQDTAATSSNSFSGGFVASSAVIQPRQPGLGLGAKFISHKDQMRHVPMNAFESKLKRQLTGGVVAAEAQRAELAEKKALPDKYQEHKMMMAARRKELQEQAEDDEDSRTRNIVGVLNKKAVVTVPSHSQGQQRPTSKNSTEASTGPAPQGKQKQQATNYKAVVHPAALKAASSSSQSPATLPSTPPASGSTKKRPTDFFSTYMDERANKMAKKKKKNQAKADPDED
ncbi:hypothetical protein BGZ70_008683 [Mortierella alpina]|uniref:Uncharacterized protein n=1 Tax=Mortierella alpina TaxID=64518 RepID=A0A9P6J3C1_MORAP|nr:hypothetical protein BGZ70_008683 [Mortierella alpina]